MDSQLGSTVEQPLTDIERRFIGNFGQPRSFDHVQHELRIDPHTTVNVDGEAVSFSAHPDDMSLLFQTALDKGWIVDLGEFDNPGKLASAAQKNKDAMETWSDEQAQILEARLLVPERQWRMSGTQYIISNAGIDKLKEPTGPVAVLSPSAVQAMVDAEWQRVVHDPDNMPPAPESGLMLGQWYEWFNEVNDEIKRVWNVELTDPADGGPGSLPPVAGGAGWTDVYENRILDHENQKTALPALVAPWFMALTILAFTDTDTPTTSQDGSHKPTYTGYADKSVAAADMNAASAGSAANANAITFAACTAGSSAILGFGNKETNGTTGDLRKYGTCTSTTVSTTQTPATFAAGTYTTTAD